MVARLNVVMNQSPPASASAQRLGEEIVGEMIGRPGIDMVLINSSSLEDVHSTDFLTLQSLAADFVYLDWKTPSLAISLLADCGIEGQRFPHAGDPPPIVGHSAPHHEPQLSRRIYVFDLGQYKNASDVCQAVYGLLSVRQIRTFSLAVDPASTASRLAIPSARAGTPRARPETPRARPETPIQPPSPRAVISSDNSPPGVSIGPPRRGLSDLQLDDLVDQLNDDELA